MHSRAVIPIRRDVAYWVEHSEAFVSAQFDDGTLSKIHIEFHGECARIPSLKNSKLPGKNFINPDTVNRLKAMDILFKRSASTYDRRLLTFGDQQVIGLLSMGKRKVRFDLDNCAATVKDWLEPASIRRRGWGVGLVNNDATVTVFPVHSSQLGTQTTHSTLILQPWNSVAPSFRSWSQRAFF